MLLLGSVKLFLSIDITLLPVNCVVESVYNVCCVVCVCIPCTGCFVCMYTMQTIYVEAAKQIPINFCFQYFNIESLLYFNQLFLTASYLANARDWTVTSV